MSVIPENPGAIIIEGHIQGLANTRALGEAGIPVYVVDKNNCIARYSKYCKKFFYCPGFEKDEFARFLMELAVKENLKDWVLFPSNDHAVYTLSKHKAELEKYFRVITPGLEIIDNIYDKSRLLSIAQRIGIPVPKTQYFASFKESLNRMEFPVLTKGRFGLSFYKALGRKAFLAGNETELQQQLKEIEKKFSIDKTFTQELIPFNGSNKTISFTAFCVKGEIKTWWAGIKLREHPRRFGTATFAKSTMADDCFAPSAALMKALKYSGICEIEYLQDPRDNQFKLIEINARTWLWVELARACGIDLSLQAYYYANNIEIYSNVSSAKILSWWNLWTDIPYSLVFFFKGKLNVFQYFKSLRGKKIVAMRFPGDNRPFWVYPLLGLQFIFRR